MGNTIRVWGHRGCRGKTNPPENSLPAFQAAIDQGADGFELDVFLTKDNQLVVFHDDTLERMTNGQGDIKSYTLAELKRLRLKDSAGQLTAASIPTLNEVLDVVGSFRSQHPHDARARHFVVNIEIKGLGIAKQVVQVVTERLEQGWTPDNLQISSFDMASLREMKKARPDIPLGALFASESEPWDITGTQLAERLASVRDIQPQTVNITLPSLTKAATWMILREGARPVAWTCNEKHPDHLQPRERHAIAARLLDNQITTIITDYPEPMRRLLSVRRHEGTASPPRSR